jgi:hypothetical protein
VALAGSKNEKIVLNAKIAIQDAMLAKKNLNNA